MAKLSDLVRNSKGETPGPSPRAAPQQPEGRILHLSEEEILRLSILYTDVVDALDDALVALRADEAKRTPDRAWRAAQKLIPEVESNARIFFALFSRHYQEKATARHSVNLLLLVAKVAAPMDLAQEEQLALMQATLYHDIGMARIPEGIVEKQRNLSDEEVSEVRRHVEHGVEIVNGVAPDLAVTLIRQSHEQEDGNGYPAGLKGDQIHPLAKLLRAADAYEALVHTRAHRSHFSPFEAMKIIKAAAGTRFGVQAFRHLLRELTVFPIGTIVELYTCERAKVVDVRRDQLLRPAVAVLTDVEGNFLPEPRFLDLATNAGVYIERALVDDDLEKLALDIF